MDTLAWQGLSQWLSALRSIGIPWKALKKQTAFLLVKGPVWVLSFQNSQAATFEELWPQTDRLDYQAFFPWFRLLGRTAQNDQYCIDYESNRCPKSPHAESTIHCQLGSKVHNLGGFIYIPLLHDLITYF